MTDKKKIIPDNEKKRDLLWGILNSCKFGTEVQKCFISYTIQGHQDKMIINDNKILFFT